MVECIGRSWIFFKESENVENVTESVYLSATRFSIAWENEIQIYFRFSFFFRAVKMELKSHCQNPIFNLDESDIRLSFFSMFLACGGKQKLEFISFFLFFIFVYP